MKVLVDIAGLSGAGKMQSRGEDIRFFTNDAGLLSYWVGQRTDLGHEVWVTIPVLGVGETLNFKLAYEIRKPTQSRFQPILTIFEQRFFVRLQCRLRSSMGLQPGVLLG